MIVYKRWRALKRFGKSDLCDGWFLFGFIPLYVRVIEAQ